MENAEGFLRDLFDVAVKVADPMVCMPATLPPKPEGRVVVVGAGKASARMAEAVEKTWGPCEGLVITRYGYERPLTGITLRSASHPVPDQAGVDATIELVELLESLGEDDFVLCLISGGGSALLCAPADGLTLEDKQSVTSALLESGAPIGDINGVRKTLSRVKGGRMAAAAFPAKMLCLMISDVPGDDPGDIASGPTVAGSDDVEQVLATLRQWSVDPPNRVKEFLASGANPLASNDPRLARVENRIVAAPSQSLEAAGERARSKQVDVHILGDDLEAEAADLGRELSRKAMEMAEAITQPTLLLSGGECTVTHRGTGVGGPNAEFTLACAVELQGHPQIHVLACDTDGVDGAAEVAGAYAGPQTLGKAVAIGLDAGEALENHDSHGFFAAIKDQVVTGPTLTNVNDFRAILIVPKGAD